MADDDAKVIEKTARRYWHEEGWLPGGTIRELDPSKIFIGLHPQLQGIKIVDTDTHFCEAPDLFTSRGAARFKGRLPELRRVDGVDRWFIGEHNFGSTGGNVIRTDAKKLLGRLAFPTLDEGHPGAYQTKARLQAMDDMGIYAQIIYQNSGVTQTPALMALRDDDLALEITRIFNDAGAERQVESGQRLFTMAMLPIWDKAAMEAEARRCIDMNMKGFNLPDTPERWGVPSYMDDYWTPFLEMCEATGTPINFHLNGGIDPMTMTWKGFCFEQTLAVSATMFSICNAATMGNWMVSGRLDRHPKLKLGMIESGVGWIPFILEYLEHQFDEMISGRVKVLKRRPWEYFRDQIWCTYWFETVGPQLLLDTIGVDKVMFETDWPHPSSLYPQIQEHIVESLSTHDYAVKKRVLETNAVELYNLEFDKA